MLRFSFYFKTIRINCLTILGSDAFMFSSPPEGRHYFLVPWSSLQKRYSHPRVIVIISEKLVTALAGGLAQGLSKGGFTSFLHESAKT